MMRYRALSPIYIFLICRFPNATTGVTKKLFTSSSDNEGNCSTQNQQKLLKNLKLFNWASQKRILSLPST